MSEPNTLREAIENDQLLLHFQPRVNAHTNQIDGVEAQAGNTRDLIFDVPRLVAHASTVFTLEPGDLILTGTPAGVGIFRTPPLSLQPGDVVEIEVERVGMLRNPVVAETLGA